MTDGLIIHGWVDDGLKDDRENDDDDDDLQTDDGWKIDEYSRVTYCCKNVSWMD